MNGCPFCHFEIVEEQKVIIKNEHCLFLQTPQEVLIGSGWANTINWITVYQKADKITAMFHQAEGDEKYTGIFPEE